MRRATRTVGRLLFLVTMVAAPAASHAAALGVATVASVSATTISGTITVSNGGATALTVSSLTHTLEVRYPDAYTPPGLPAGTDDGYFVVATIPLAPPPPIPPGGSVAIPFTVSVCGPPVAAYPRGPAEAIRSVVFATAGATSDDGHSDNLAVPNQAACPFCGNGIVEPETEQCEPPGTPTCDDQCYIRRDCGNGVVDSIAGEECEPPGTATCDASCRFIHTCGNGVVELGEECDGQPGCSAECRLVRSLCCEIGGGCLSGSATDAFGEYQFFKPCYLLAGGTGSYGVCEGPDECPPPFPPGIGCHAGPCGDRPIDPLPLCCQGIDDTCQGIVATSEAAVGSFGCEAFPPPDQGDVPRLMIGTCGADGRCVPGGGTATP